MFPRALHDRSFFMVLLLISASTCACLAEHAPTFDLDEWAPEDIWAYAGTRYGLVAWGRRLPAYSKRVHLYYWKFTNHQFSTIPPQRPLPEATKHQYEPGRLCLEGDFFPALGHIYHAVSSDPLSRDGTETAARAVRVDRSNTPPEFLPRADRYVFTPYEKERVGGAGRGVSGLHGQSFIVQAIKTDDRGEPLAVVQFGKKVFARPGDQFPYANFTILAPQELKVGGLLRFGDRSHRVTRIVPSREQVAIDGKQGYLLGWIEVDPLPVEEQAPEEIANSVGMSLRRILPGKFVMGSPPGEEGRFENEGPQHGVRITRPFYLGATEVTQGQYERVMGENPSRFQGDPERPVENVSWHNAVEFCRRLTGMEGRQYRLPTEAEWEYACRAGTQTPFFWGDSDAESVIKEHGWYNQNAQESHWTEPHAPEEGTQPVGRKRANAWGLYDMTGNVGEWCADRYDDDYYRDWPEDDSLASTPDWPRVIRGGCWARGARQCRSAFRTGQRPQTTWSQVGFRVAASLEPAEK